jgi:predicted GNAT family N-acyltransferase
MEMPDGWEWIPCTNKHTDTYSRCMRIRHIVFNDEQQVPMEIEFEYEDECSHFLLTVGGKDAANARFRKMEDGYKCERVAVMEDFRGKGIGKVLMQNLIREIKTARGAGTEAIVIHAQLPAIDFWKKLNFVPHGDLFDEGGIMHYNCTLDESK